MYRSRPLCPDAEEADDWVAKELAKVKVVEAEIEVAEAEDLTVYENIGRHMRALQDRIEALEDSAITHGGTWKADRRYKPNVLVTDKGASWISRVACSEGCRPGESINWKLTAKAPRGNA
jgi:hypothetical protein